MENLAFYTENFKAPYPDRKVRYKGFDDLYNFIEAYGKNLVSFSCDIGDGMDVMKLLNLVEGENLKSLRLLSLYKGNIAQIPLLIQGPLKEMPTITLGALCDYIRQREAFSSLESLFLDCPIEDMTDVLGISSLVGGQGHPAMRSVGVKAANSYVKVEQEYILPGNTALLKASDVLIGKGLSFDKTWMKEYAMQISVERTDNGQVSIVIMG